MCEQKADRLVVWQKGNAFFVGWAENTDDWIARFDRRAGFPARAWAERMVELHNSGQREPQDPVGHAGDYAP